jgi:peptidoglycan/LPS O-acetylase OafA/YrhL
MWLWLVTYTTNIYIALHGHWIGRMGPFWSLAVEEQFYLVWPWFIMMAPRRWFVPATTVGILLAPLYRLTAAVMFPDDLANHGFVRATLTPGSLDALGGGALLALAGARWRGNGGVAWPTSPLLPSLAAAVYGVILGFDYYRGTKIVSAVLGDVTVSALCVWLVAVASRRVRGPIGHVLELKPLTYLGKISYGVYAYHSFVPALVALAFARFGAPFREISPTNFVFSTIATVGVAAVSWHVFERPINAQKRRFHYAPAAAATTADPTPAGVVHV